MQVHVHPSVDKKGKATGRFYYHVQHDNGNILNTSQNYGDRSSAERGGKRFVMSFIKGLSKGIKIVVPGKAVSYIRYPSKG